MAKKKNESTELTVPSTLTPAAVIGLNTTKIEIDQNQLPEEFRGVNLEVIETGFAPTVKWNAPGNFVAGTFVELQSNIGPNKANLYLFDAKGKSFGVWGTTVLDRAFATALETGAIRPGYLCMITYIADMPSDYEANPTKLFHIQVAKKNA